MNIEVREQHRREDIPSLPVDTHPAFVAKDSAISQISRDLWAPPNAAGTARQTPDAFGKPGASDSVAGNKPSDQDSSKAVILDPKASAEDKLKAIDTLARQGVQEITLPDACGIQRVCRLEIEGTGSKSLVHLFAVGDDGREHVVLRAVKNADGSFEHERDDDGNEVSYNGSWWSSHVGNNSNLMGVEQQAPRLESRRFPNQAHSAFQLPEPGQSIELPATGLDPWGAMTAADLYDPGVLSTHRARGTGYYPYNNSMEGGYEDRKGHQLYTLQDYLAGNAPYVSVAMDVPAARYGTLLRIPEMESKYGVKIPFRVVDTGSAFKHKGRSRIDICTRDYDASNDATINGPLTLQFLS
jgi:hypothetical protein